MACLADGAKEGFAITSTMKVAFVTFGCRLNRAESLDLEARYQAAGHEIVDLGMTSRETGGKHPVATNIPDLILVRGCSVTAKAQRDCEKVIAHLHARYPSTEIRPIGCLPNAQPPPTPPLQLPTTNHQLSTTNSIPLQTSRAYLKIQDGCSGKCTFCIVPHFRGSPVSVPIDEIMVRTRAFLTAGYREIVLTGCNLSLYKSGGHNFASLLDILAELGTDPNWESRHLGGVSPDDAAKMAAFPVRCLPVGNVPMREMVGSVPARIRIGSLEPSKGCEEILDVMGKHPNICRFLHLSLQSGSDRILKRMKRPYNIELVDRFCTMARERLGTDLALGADVITGFPGETDEDFAATRDFLVRHAFSNLHVFPYSERPGTPAATMDGSVPRPVRLVRARNLTALGHTQRAAFAQSFLGREVEVCVEHGGEHGWTDAYLPCKWKGPAERRSLVRTRVIAVEGDMLLAAAP